MSMIFHHIGFLTENINRTVNQFKFLNYKKEKKLFIDKVFKVKIQFIKLNTNIIELIKPSESNIGLKNMLKNKNYAYHFAYKVYDIDHEISKLEKKFKLIVKPTPAIAFNNKKVSFFKMKNGFIIELIEK
jgi:methylmalonyl-CoA/ethylmalonyl-CoA epimerase